MNRKGFTAIVDAGFFIVLIGIAVTLLSQAVTVDTENDIEELSDICDTVFNSRISTHDAGYEGDDRIMAFSDIAAASVKLGDGKAGEYVRSILDRLYPWENAYSVKIVYEGCEQIINGSIDGRTAVTRTYPVEFGGEILVTVSLNVRRDEQRYILQYYRLP